MQQDTTAIPHSVFTIAYLLATFIGGGAAYKFLELYLNRKKPVVEVQKVEAETTEITIRSHAVAGDSMIRMMDRLDDALNTIDALREERNDLREKTDKQEMELESYERQMKRMKAVMDLKGVRLSDYDEPRS